MARLRFDGLAVGIAVLFLAAFVCGCSNDSDSDTDGDTDTDSGGASYDPRFLPLVESIETELLQSAASGVAVAVIEGGEITFSGGFGTKRPLDGDKVEDTTLFRIGSITKMMTAIALLRQVDAGLLELDDPITRVLDGLEFTRDPSWAPSIQVEHLLTHGSGLADVLELSAPPDEMGDGGLAKYVNGRFGEVGYLMAPAGRMYNYSNPNFTLAGLMAEELAGEPYRTLVDRVVFDPLGMQRTLFTPEDVLLDGDYAFGMSSDFETGMPWVVEPDTYENPWGRPAGYAWSSVLDLAQMISFIRVGNTDVLSDELREEMIAPQRITLEFLDKLHYGYGFVVQQGLPVDDALSKFYDVTIISHGGAIPGHAASMTYCPEADIGFITLANGDGAYFPASVLTAFESLGELGPLEDGPDLSQRPYDDFAGRFMDPFNVGEIIVSVDGESLLVEMPTVDLVGVPYEKELTPMTPNNFLLNIQEVDLLVTFVFDDQNAVEYFRTRAFVGRRQDDEPPTGEPSPPPDPARLERALARPAFVRTPQLIF